MQVKLALLADSANVSQEGKLNILGVFDTIYVRTFPTTHPHMQLVVRFQAAAHEVGNRRKVEIQLATQEGRVLFRLPGAITVQQRETGEMVGIDHILTMNNVAFESSGRYAFRVVVEDVVEAVVPLRVEQIPSQH